MPTAGDPERSSAVAPGAVADAACAPTSSMASTAVAADAEAAESDDAVDEQLRLALATLAELDGGNGVSLPRLAKRTGLRVSVLLRLYTLMSDARVGDDTGPGWVRLHVDEDGRWIARMTAAGRGDVPPDGAPDATAARGE